MTFKKQFANVFGVVKPIYDLKQK